MPSVHRVGINNPEFRLPAEKTFLYDLTTVYKIGISANTYFSPEFLFDRPFDEFTHVSTGRRLGQGIDANKFFLQNSEEGFKLYFDFIKKAIRHEYPLKSIGNGVLAQINVSSARAPIPKLVDDGAQIIINKAKKDIKPEEQNLIILNFMDAHVPLRHNLHYDNTLHSAGNGWDSRKVDDFDVIENGPDKFRNYLIKRRGVYAAAIDYLDKKIAKLFRTISESSSYETTLIVTSDHGENLGYENERFRLGHRENLHESLLHVPFYIVNPPVGSPRYVRRFTSHLHLGKLIKSVLDGSWNDIGQSVVKSEVIGKPIDNTLDKNAPTNEIIRCLYNDNKKYVWDSTGSERVYLLDESLPCKQILLKELSVPDEFKSKFDVDINDYKHEIRIELDEKTPYRDQAIVNQLKKLGYI
jgi:hypothetical protein